MISLLPQRDFELFSPLRAEEALGLLSGFVKPIERRESRKPEPTDGRFQGVVRGNHFEIRRDIGYRNSFLPFIHGVILPSGKGSVMQIEMRMHPAARRFLLAWLGAVLLCFLLFTFVMPSGDTFSTLLLRIIPFFMLAFGVFITIIGFYPEAKIAQEFLRDTFRASELDPRE